MDLDSFHKEFLHFKAKVAPMLAEWEAMKKDPGISEELKAEIYAPLKPVDPMKPAASGDGSDVGGPTVEEWVAAGYKASAYPPAGYKAKSSQADIDAAVAAEKAKT